MAEAATAAVAAGTAGPDLEEFVRRFQAGWSASSLEMHNELWTDEIELHQPILGSLYGRDQCNRAFEKMFTLSPDLTLDVREWEGAGHHLYISFVFRTTFGGSELRWAAVDQFLLNDEGLILRRDSYFDPLPVLRHMLLHPRGWPQALRARLIPKLQDKRAWHPFVPGPTSGRRERKPSM